MRRFALAARLLATTIILQAGGSDGGQTPPPPVAGFESDEGHVFINVNTDATATIDSGHAHSGTSSLRIDHDLPRRSSGYEILFRDVHPGHLPPEPWGLEVYARASTPQELSFLFRLEEESGELWDASVTFTTSEETIGQWRRVVVPFAWLHLITWERRDGILDLDKLRSITLTVRPSGGAAQEGALWLDSFRFIDARNDVSAAGDATEGFVPLDLTNVFDSDAIAWRSNPTDGDFHTGAWEPRTLPAEHFPQEAQAALAGIPFLMPPYGDGLNNHIRSNGQYLAGFPREGYTAAYFLGSGKFGDQTGDVLLEYTDGTTSAAALQISDWSMRPQFEETVGLLLPYAYFRNEIDRAREPRLFIQSVAVDPGRELASIRVPVNDFLKIFGITLSTAEEPPAIGMMADAPIGELDPRYHMPPREELDFTGPAEEVGVLGGYLRRRMGGHVLEIPTHNGFLTHTADARELPLSRLHWHRYQNRGQGYTLGGVHVPSEAESPARVEMDHGTSLIYTTRILRSGGDGAVEETFTARHSRAWPAAFHHIEGPEFQWYDDHRGNNLHATIPTANGTETFDIAPGAELPIPAEPWILFWNSVPANLHRESNTEDVRSFGTPMLLVPERMPDSIIGAPGPYGSLGLTFRHGGAAGHFAAMPLQGILTVDGAETLEWAAEGVPEPVIEQARTWAARLQLFPAASERDATVDEEAGTVTISETFEWIEMDSQWDIEPLPFAPIPPVVLLARANGYDAVLPGGIVDGHVSTFYGPLFGVEGDTTSYTIPLSPYTSSMVTLGNTTGVPLLEEARSELAGITEVTAGDVADFHSVSDISADVANLRYQAPLRLLLGEAPLRREYSNRVVRNALQPYNLKLEKEPLSNQFFLMDDRFWAKDEAYDKEWSVGFILQGLWSNAYYNNDWDYIAENWNEISGLYRYYRVIFDWATNSTFTMTTGSGANSDGIRIAFDGMLAYARMAGALGMDEARHDALVRSARQQLSLFASWHSKRWAADHDYLISRYNHVREEETEMLFSPDHLWSEFLTTNAAFPETDFFQTTHALYLFNLAHLMFLMDYGIHEARLREWLFERVPELHPEWCDGNARPAWGGRYYGDSSVMTLLVARAILFPGSLAENWECLRSSIDGTAVLDQWYGPRGVVPMVLAGMITGRAPLVIVPVLSYATEANTFDAESGVQRILLTATDSGEAALRIRTRGYTPVSVSVEGETIAFTADAGSGELVVPLAADAGESREIIVHYEGVE